jgi:hypothetical protein
VIKSSQYENFELFLKGIKSLSDQKIVLLDIFFPKAWALIDFSKIIKSVFADAAKEAGEIVNSNKCSVEYKDINAAISSLKKHQNLPLENLELLKRYNDNAKKNDRLRVFTTPELRFWPPSGLVFSDKYREQGIDSQAKFVKSCTDEIVSGRKPYFNRGTSQEFIERNAPKHCKDQWNHLVGSSMSSRLLDEPFENIFRIQKRMKQICTSRLSSIEASRLTSDISDIFAYDIQLDRIFYEETSCSKLDGSLGELLNDRSLRDFCSKYEQNSFVDGARWNNKTKDKVSFKDFVERVFGGQKFSGNRQIREQAESNFSNEIKAICKGVNQKKCTPCSFMMNYPTFSGEVKSLRDAVRSTISCYRQSRGETVFDESGAGKFSNGTNVETSGDDGDGVLN